MKWTVLFAIICLLSLVLAASEKKATSGVARARTSVGKQSQAKPNPNGKFDRAARRRKTKKAGGKRRRGKGAKKQKQGRRG